VHEDGTIETRAEKVVSIGEVMCINCSQISSTVRSVSARESIQKQQIERERKSSTGPNQV
jgi:hypothetical protein